MNDTSREPERGSARPSGTGRSGRRAVPRQRPAAPAGPLERFRTPILALAIAAVVIGVSAFVLVGAAAPSYACTTVDTVQTPVEGDLGQVQPDMGRNHVPLGEKVRYASCPPASGKHVNRANYGPLEPRVYGPDDDSKPTGWIHNLEHGALVILYSCERGACDDASLEVLRQASQAVPASAVCGIPSGVVGPVVARFEEMPTRFAALVWGRVLYLDDLDTAAIGDFFTRYGERVDGDGNWIAPPEPQCNPPAPSPEPSASATAAPTEDPSASPSEVPSASAEASPSPS